MDDGDIMLVLARGDATGFTGPIRSDDFHYVCPIEAVRGAVLIERQDGHTRHHLYLQPRSPLGERWTGPTIGPGEDTAAEQAFDAALPVGNLVPDVVRMLTAGRTLYVSSAAPANGAQRREELVEAVREGLPSGLTLSRRDMQQRGAQKVEEQPDATARIVRSAAPILTGLRATKSETEIAYVRRAIDATILGLLDTGRTLRPGLAEYQIQGLIEFRCKLAGCERQAFDSIVGSGPNSCILHYGANRRIMQDGDLVVVDVGGEYRGYAADVTRTFPVNGRFTKRQAEVYDAVLEAQKAGIAAVRPGVTLGQVHAAAKAVLEKHGLSRWFIHRTSHSVGLNVHDVWGRSRKLEVGSIMTVEPGVYIPSESLGVRIEDTLLVTEDGSIVLSAGAPKERHAVEALMAEDAPIPMTAPNAR